MRVSKYRGGSRVVSWCVRCQGAGIRTILLQFAGGYYPSAGRVVIPDPTGERPTELVVATHRVDQHLVHAESPRPHRDVEIQLAGGYYPHQAGHIFLALSGERPKRGGRRSIPGRPVSNATHGPAIGRGAPCEVAEGRIMLYLVALCRILLPRVFLAVCLEPLL